VETLEILVSEAPQQDAIYSRPVTLSSVDGHHIMGTASPCWKGSSVQEPRDWLSNGSGEGGHREETSG
jgi:hypothetical protein